MNLTGNLEGQPSHFSHQTDAAPSRIDVCYGDPTTIIRAEARYGPLPLGPTGHSPPHIRLTIPNLPPSPLEDADQGLPPRLKMHGDFLLAIWSIVRVAGLSAMEECPQRKLPHIINHE